MRKSASDSIAPVVATTEAGMRAEHEEEKEETLCLSVALSTGVLNAIDELYVTIF